jgi:hypothetical protein
MSAAIRLAADGTVLGQPRRSAAPRVFIEGSGQDAGYAISPEGFSIIRDDPVQRTQFVSAATSFRAFVSCWRFLDQEHGVVRTLGENLWSGQEDLIAAMDEHAWIYCLKGRQIGATSLGIAYDAWVARFRNAQARVHVFSSGDDAAKEVLEQVAFGLAALPPSMQLPTSSTAHAIRLDTGAGTRAFVRSYPSTRAASRGSTCNHLHLDEWSSTIDPSAVLQATSPTVAPGGTFAILTTESVGPESESASYYRRCKDGLGKHVPIFISSLSRPDRDEAWHEGMRRSMPPANFAREYPVSWEEALASAGERYFPSHLLDLAAEYALGFHPAREAKGIKYVCGVDVALQGSDSTVLIVLELDAGQMDVVHLVRLTGAQTPSDVKLAIMQVSRLYPRCTFLIEDTGPGYAIRADLDIPERYLSGFVTTALSKSRILGALYMQLSEQLMHWIPEECPELDAAMRGLRFPGPQHTADEVMSLSLAVEAANAAYQAHSEEGRILKVLYT